VCRACRSGMTMRGKKRERAWGVGREKNSSIVIEQHPEQHIKIAEGFPRFTSTNYICYIDIYVFFEIKDKSSRAWHGETIVQIGRGVVLGGYHGDASNWTMSLRGEPPWESNSLP